MIDFKSLFTDSNDKEVLSQLQEINPLNGFLLQLRE